jgi:branched-chain amino acid aminotransferase
MELIETIPVQKVKYTGLQDADLGDLEFGKYVSDHMFLCHYENGEWQAPRILPFGNLSLSPLALALHYGQSIFEGMKAFRMQDGSVNIFRIEKHHERLNRSLLRMCMPLIPYELFRAALQQLVGLDRDWVPGLEGSALYLRPLVFASEARFGIKVSDEYRFLIVTGPVPSLYPKPLTVKVERNYIRAAKGGTGYAKCAGNYGGVFYPTQLARQEGFDQVVWMDARDHEYFEESGTMNLMFLIDGVLVTPPVSDSILDGVTRDSLLQIARDLGIPVEERPVGITEFVKAFKARRITEVFGAGTAAVIASIAVMDIEGERYELPSLNGNSVAARLKKELEAIRSGKKEDRWGWNCVLD